MKHWAIRQTLKHGLLFRLEGLFCKEGWAFRERPAFGMRVLRLGNVVGAVLDGTRLREADIFDVAHFFPKPALGLGVFSLWRAGVYLAASVVLCGQSGLLDLGECAAVTRARHKREASQWEDTYLSGHFLGVRVCTRCTHIKQFACTTIHTSFLPFKPASSLRLPPSFRRDNLATQFRTLILHPGKDKEASNSLTGPPRIHTHIAAYNS